jgi:Tfp pilus assembly ATPase PilU
MVTMDQELARLVRSGKITMELALERSHHEDDVRRLVTSGA